MPPTGKCTQVGMYENVHSTWEKHEIIAKPQQRGMAAQHRTDEQWCKNNTSNTLVILKTLHRELYYRLHTPKGMSVNL